MKKTGKVCLNGGISGQMAFRTRADLQNQAIGWADGEFTGRYETFAAGFARTSPLLSPQDAVQRPVGIAQGPDGSLYVTADVGGKVWRIVYRGM